VSRFIAIPAERDGARSLAQILPAQQQRGQDDKSSPIIAHGSVLSHYGFESHVAANQDFAEQAFLT